MKIAARCRSLAPSITLAVSAQAKALKAQGQDIVAFGAGEPDFDTPEHIKEAAIKALRDGVTRYTPAAGMPVLREAVAAFYQDNYGLPAKAGNVVITCGGKHALYNIFQLLLERGDEVLIPAPYWVSYPEMVTLAEGVPVIVPTTEDSDFRVTVDLLREYATERTRVLIVNSPSNPTGAAYTREQLLELGRFAIEKDLVIVSDEIYEKLVYDGFEFTCFPTLSAELRARTVVVSGASKTYAMTGWRIGWAVGPEDFITKMNFLQSHSTSNPTSFAQSGALAALQGPQDCVAMMVAAFADRRKYILERLAALPGVTTFAPQGAFYVFPKFEAYYGQSAGGVEIVDSLSFCKFLLERAQVAAVPGIGFGADANIRLSYATSMEQIEKGLDRIAGILGELSVD
ncbi:MAG TPA: pyridoxal phosphate-dependent aminotransferase [bacterium]|nr:pyridoxal phosphate-dependent aminotransferase [bacterium]